MPAEGRRVWMTEEWSFAVLRALTMLGGMVALFLGPIRPEHQPHLAPLAWSFVAYKALLFLAIWAWPAKLRLLLLGTVWVDLVFVALFVWFSGGIESHFYLLFYLLVALSAFHFSPGMGLTTAAGAGVLYSLACVGGDTPYDWHQLVGRIATFFLLGGPLGYLSQRERTARATAERLNQELRENQARLEKAYQALRAAQQRLVESERLATIGQMSAKIAHEVRNPLGSISLNAELLEDELRTLPEERRAEAAGIMAAIRSQVEVLSAVTEEYLRFARLPTPKLEAGSVAPVIEDLAEFVRAELRARGVELSLDVPDGLPTLQLDAAQIRQALLNLVRNAAEAMPNGGIVTIAARQISGSERTGAEEQRSGGALKGGDISSAALPLGSSAPPWLEIRVTDTGMGIPPENLGRIFEPFFTTKEGGTGLGLAIARQIALDHGGDLTCQSTPGVETIFRLILPVPEGGRDA